MHGNAGTQGDEWIDPGLIQCCAIVLHRCVGQPDWVVVAVPVSTPPPRAGVNNGHVTSCLDTLSLTALIMTIRAEQFLCKTTSYVEEED
jgi:hypothetical protein